VAPVLTADRYSLTSNWKARLGILAYWWPGAREGFPLRFFGISACHRQQKIDASLAIVGRTKNYGGPFQNHHQRRTSSKTSSSYGLTTQAASAISATCPRFGPAISAAPKASISTKPTP